MAGVWEVAEKEKRVERGEYSFLPFVILPSTSKHTHTQRHPCWILAVSVVGQATIKPIERRKSSKWPHVLLVAN